MPRVRVLLLAAALAPLALPAGQADAAAKAKPRLQAFGGCDTLTTYARRNSRAWKPGGPPVAAVPRPAFDPELSDSSGSSGTAVPVAGAPAASRGEATGGGGEDFSLTNNQEAGVFEADTVKTDGKLIYSVGKSALQVVDTATGKPVKVGSLQLGGDAYGARLLLRGKRLLVMWEQSSFAVAASSVAIPGLSRTTIAQVDVSDPDNPVLLRTATLDGSLLAARRVGGFARVVLQSQPRAELVPQKADRTVARAWLPRARFANARTGRKRSKLLVRCNAVRRPKSFSGLNTTTVITFDMDGALDPVDADAVMAGGDTVYASATSLFVASRRHQPDVEGRTSGAIPKTTTQIHRFDIGEPGKTTYKGTGEVPGYLLSQFALSDRAGVLRVASTTEPPWFEDREQDPSESLLTTLTLGDSGLTPLGQIAGLGKGERIYAVRFLDTAAFVVTFRQVDPLYTVDLTDPANPVVRGELKLLGYSAYLHPTAPGRLLGVGQDATPQGRTTGTQLSLFDVSDLAAPKLLQQRSVGDNAFSPVEDDHLAFLYWPKRNLAVFPVSTFSDNASFNGAIGFTVGDGAIGEAGRVSHSSDASITRELVIGDTLYTLSDAGLRGTRLDGWGDAGFAAF